METMLLDISVMQTKEWVMTSHNVVLEEGRLKVKASKTEETMIAYFNAHTLFKIPVPDTINEPYNGYKIICTGQTTDNLEIQIGITRYFEDKSNFTRFYKLNEVIEVESEGVEAFSLVLKCSGTGEFSLNKLTLSTFFNENRHYRIDKKETLDKIINQIVIPSYRKNSNIKPIKIAVILDEFSFQCFKGEAECYPINSEHWREEIDTFRPDILFVESVWYGKDKSWEQKIGCYKQECAQELKDLVRYCKTRGIKTVFWNKEGLVNFEYFKRAGALFDVVFVTDERIIREQKQLCGHNKVYVLPFAAQPKLHNSINKYAYYLGKVAFAGNWYGDKHPKRLVDMQNIVEPAFEFDLDIYDRSYERKEELIKVGYYWPYPYRSFIVGGVPYEIMVQLYKYYHIFLNVNSIQDSRGMIARRVYEIMMTKTVVVSGESLGIQTQLNDYIYCPKNANETKEILSYLLQNPILRAQRGKQAQRYILENHIYEKRLEQILETIGMPYESTRKPMVSIIAWIEDLDSLIKIYEQVKKQNYENINLKVFYPIENRQINSYSCLVKEIDFYPTQPGKFITTLLDKCKGKTFAEYIAIMYPNHIYGENYIRDYMNTFKYVEADIIGKSTIFSYLSSIRNLYKINYGKGEDCYCDAIIPGSWIAKCTAVTYEMLEILLKENPIRSYMKELSEKKYTIYSDDAFNMCVLEDKYIPEDAEFIMHGSNYNYIVEI